jgi:hypothetical protein
MEAFQVVGAIVLGLFFSFTPIPLLPRLYLIKLRGLKEERTGPVLFIAFAVFGALWACLPIAFIYAIGSANALAGAAFAVAMYWNLLRR